MHDSLLDEAKKAGLSNILRNCIAHHAVAQQTVDDLVSDHAAAANDALYDENAAAFEISPNEQADYFSEMDSVIRLADNDTNPLAHALKCYIDDRVECNVRLGCTDAKSDVFYSIIRKFANAAGAQYPDMQESLNLVTAYYHAGFKAQEALGRLVHTCCDDARTHRDIYEYALARLRNDNPNKPDAMLFQGMPLAMAAIRQEVLDRAFFLHLSPLPAAGDIPEHIPAHLYLMLDAVWQLANEQASISQPEAEIAAHSALAAQIAKPMLQRLYQSGKWRCETVADVEEGLAAIGRVEQQMLAAHTDVTPDEAVNYYKPSAITRAYQTTLDGMRDLAARPAPDKRAIRSGDFEANLIAYLKDPECFNVAQHFLGFARHTLEECMGSAASGKQGFLDAQSEAINLIGLHSLLAANNNLTPFICQQFYHHFIQNVERAQSTADEGNVLHLRPQPTIDAKTVVTPLHANALPAPKQADLAMAKITEALERVPDLMALTSRKWKADDLFLSYEARLVRKRYPHIKEESDDFVRTCQAVGFDAQGQLFRHFLPDNTMPATMLALPVIVAAYDAALASYTQDGIRPRGSQDVLQRARGFIDCIPEQYQTFTGDIPAMLGAVAHLEAQLRRETLRDAGGAPSR